MKFNPPIQPEGVLGKLADICMMPLMYTLAGTFRETAQRTHRWNVQRILGTEVTEIPEQFCAVTPGTNQAKRAYVFGLPLLHIPLLGCWKEYVVLEPKSASVETWFVGWKTPTGAGVSRIPLSGSVRLLRGPSEAQFFGIEEKTANVISLQSIGSGTIGDSGPYKDLPLL